jgi:hypothetical protein
MAYEHTVVAVAKSQQKLRELLLRNGASGIAIVSQPPQEGFQAMVKIDAATYTIRISATCKEKRAQAAREQEERRVWRVLFHHLKGIFEASHSGVMEFKEMVMPYIVTKDGRTIGEIILPQLDKAIQTNPARMLPMAATGGER